MTHGTSILPVTEQLTQTPVICSAGTCFVHEPRGSVEGVGRYLYAIFSLTDFWQYDIWCDAWHQLASPTVVAGMTFGAGVAMCMDASRSRVYLFVPSSNAPFTDFQYYNITNDTWVGAAEPVDPALMVQWSTDAQLLHLCSLENSNNTVAVPLDLNPVFGGERKIELLDDHIYLIGNNNATLYRYSISGDVWTLVAPTGGARGGVAAASATLNWMPDLWYLDPFGAVPTASEPILYSWRGGGSTILDIFFITGARWVPSGLTAAASFDTGTCSIYDVTDSPSIVLYRNATMSLRAYRHKWQDHRGVLSRGLVPMGTFAGVDGVAHVGNLLTYARFEDGTTYYYFAKHSERAFMRLLRVAVNIPDVGGSL
jgi:hypothetical protein